MGAALLLALVAGAAACGYRLAGTGSGGLPPHIVKIVVLPFENRTKRPEIEQRVTEEVAREMSKRGRYQVVTDRAAGDAMLEGAITEYRTAPVEFNAEGRATKVEAVISMQATLRELATDVVLWSQAGLVFRQQYEVLESEVFFDTESVALDEIAEGAAGALVTSILEGF